MAILGSFSLLGEYVHQSIESLGNPKDHKIISEHSVSNVLIGIKTL